MYNDTQDLLNALHTTPDALTAMLAAVSPEQARLRSGPDGGWSVVEVLCHLRDSENIALNRERLIRTQDRPVVASLNADAIAASGHYREADLQDVLAEFIRLRMARWAELTAQPATAWDRTCLHEVVGEWSIRHHVLHWVWHDLSHIAQIAQVLSTFRP